MIALKDLSHLCDLHGPLKMIHCLKDDDAAPQYLLTGLLKRNRDEDTVWWPLNADELLEGLENEEDEEGIFVYIAYEVNDTMSDFFGSENDESYKSCLLTPTFEKQTDGKWLNCGTQTDYNDDWTCRQILIENKNQNDISQGLLTDLVVVVVAETGKELWKDQTPGAPEHMTIKLYFRGDDEYAIICDDFLQEQNP